MAKVPCPPHANSISYELEDLKEEVVHKALALAVTTRAMRGNAPLEVEEEEKEENPLGEIPYFLDLENVTREARKATKALERKNEIVHERDWSNVVHDLDGSDVGEWEGPGIPIKEFDSVRRPKADRVDGYDLWADLSSLKADITFGQLLEMSPVARKTLKDGMLVNRRAKRPKMRVSARVQMQGRTREVKAVEIEVTVVDKVVPNVLVDGESSLNLLPEHTMRKLGLSSTGPSSFVINMANVVPVGIIKDCRLNTGGEEYIVTFQVIKMHDNKDAFPILLGRPWLRMANAVVDWGGQKPSITYGPEDNRIKVSIAPLSGWVREEIDPILDEEENGGSNEKFDDTLVGVVQMNKEKAKMYSTSGFLSPSF